MSNLALRIRLAKQSAEKLLRDESRLHLPIDIEGLAASRDIVIQAKPDTSAGVSGMLLRFGDTFGIMYATHVESDGFQRFSVAHELGHYFLEGHLDHVLPQDGVHQSEAGFRSSNPFEMEADSFASGLLMPAEAVMRELATADEGLVAVRVLSSRCRTSLTASAIRYAELTEAAVAVVVSSGKTIDYCILSERMKDLPGLAWLRRGSSLPVDTATFDFNTRASSVSDADVTVEIPVENWLGGQGRFNATEEVVALGSYGKTLTVIHCAAMGNAVEGGFDDDDEATLIESWKPRFRS